MRKGLLLLFCFSCYIIVSEQKSTPEDDHYWAGVVEFAFRDKWDLLEPSDINTAKNLEKYKQIIDSPEADPVDILVFPEFSINVIETATFVPATEARIAPCDNPEYAPIVREISCLAKSRQKYLVINVIEKAFCPDHGDTRPCAKNGLNHFNTNVVFDRNGVVIARYRKFNLFSEPGLNVTTEAQLVQFDTDFGVTFGTFICFDLMFDKPALQLVRNGITDIVYPTMWFSELPFVTAVQIQQFWAYANNVNFLAAQGSYPEIGTTGTGIYAGRRGRIVSVINHKAEVNLYVAQVPKIDRPEATVTRKPVNKFSPAEMTSLRTTRDPSDYHVNSSLPLENNDNYKITLCQDQLCCDFTLNYTVSLPTINQPYYRYLLTTHEGRRSFYGNADGITTACAIFACAGDEPETCATRFDSTANVAEAIQFNSIEVSGVFSGGQELFLGPNSVDTSMLPLDVDEFEYSERPYSDDCTPFKEVRHKLVRPRSDLYTFGIYGRRSIEKNKAQYCHSDQKLDEDCNE